ncbi:MAG: hypothetical protein QOE14_2254 [Humisphaera sp.]|nr:hypothetical protein [Humisphaera sp.]
MTRLSSERRTLTPSLRYSGERVGERGKVRVESENRSIRRTGSSAESNAATQGAPLAPLPSPLPGVPGRGSKSARAGGGE